MAVLRDARPSTLTGRAVTRRSSALYRHWPFRCSPAATLERLPVHRQLDEALAQGPDPLHLASVFGLDPKTAIRYAENARMLLVTAAEQQDPASSHEPKGLNRS